MKVARSAELFARCCVCIPGGVNSPVRAFRSVGGDPLFISAGDGAYLIDADGNRYIDYVCSWGAQLVGHAHPAVVAAVQQAATNGLGFGAPNESECRFAETLVAAIPSMEMVRAVSSGTEATMSAIRTARGYTKRDRIVKFAGCYHGHADSLLVAAGSGALTLALPSCAGVPSNAVADTRVLPYNDTQALSDYFAAHGDSTAAVIIEPIAGNMNLICAEAEFLQTLRTLCDQHGTVLIFDEVMSGFRVAAGGAQQLYNIQPDMTCLGKVVGGGLNVAAFGGRRDIMQSLAPLGDVYQAGTLSGNPLALSAGLAVLDIILSEGFYPRISENAQQLTATLSAAATAAGVDFSCKSIGAMFGIYFAAQPPANLSDAEQCDTARFPQFFHAMLANGVYLAPSAFEAGFISAAHDSDTLAATKIAAEKSFAEIAT